MDPDQQTKEFWWQKPFDPSITMRSQIQSIAILHADRPAVLIGPDEWLTHGDLHDRADELKSTIAAAHHKNPTPIVCLVGTNASLYICLISVINANTNFSMLDPASPPKRNKMAADSIGAQIVLVDNTTANLAQAIVGDTGSIINIDNFDHADIPKDYNVPTETKAKVFIFTSGSTGQPKGVIRSLTSMLHTQYNFSNRYSYEPSDIMLYMGSPGHVGTVNDALSVLLNGHGSVALSLENLDISAVWKTIIKHKVTKASLPPSLMRVCLQYGAQHEKAESLCNVAASGEPLLRSDVGLFYRVFDESVKLWQSYGSTECGHICAGYYSPEDAVGTGPLPISLIPNGVSVEIIDENGVAVLSGNEGAIRVRSLSLADGYTSVYESQENGFGHDDQGNYFMTGDRAEVLENKRLLIKGRPDRQVNIHGRRLELSEVESAILSLDGWGEASVVVLDAGDRSSQIGALVSTTDDDCSDTKRLTDDLGTMLPQSAIPKLVKVVDRLPKTMTGKVDLIAVTKMLEHEQLQTHLQDDLGVEKPVGPTENWIADAWQEVMQFANRPSRCIGFDEYGGDSLNAIQLCLTLSQQFGIEIGIDFITDHPTIAMQATFLQQGDLVVRHNRFVVLKESSDGPVIFLFPGLGGHAWVYRAFARELRDQACDLVAMNYLVSGGLNYSRLHPEQLAQELVEYICAHQLEKRRVIFAGFSLGSLVCASVANAIRDSEHEIKIHGLLLLDPSPLFSMSRTRQGVRLMKNKLKQLLSVGSQSVQEDKAQRHLDLDVQRTSMALKEYYCPSRTFITNHRCSVLLTQYGVSEKAINQRIYDRAMKNGDLTIYDDLDHLDILRDKGVKRCAQWVWEQVEMMDADTV